MTTKQTIEGYITLAGLTVPKFVKLMGDGAGQPTTDAWRDLTR